MPQTRSQRKAQASKPPLWRVLLLATRPNTLAASFTPVLVGYVIASAELGTADARAAFAFWAFACLIQIVCAAWCSIDAFHLV